MPINIARVRNGLFYAALAGLGAFAVSLVIMAVLLPLEHELTEIWWLIADVQLIGVVAFNVIGFFYGYRLSKGGQGSHDST